jgi:hypothetical protein
VQRLEWLEEAQRIAEKSGALERYRLISENHFQFTALSS